MWCLMNEGKRQAVMPQVIGQAVDDVDRALLRWVDDHVFGKREPPHR